MTHSNKCLTSAKGNKHDGWRPAYVTGVLQESLLSKLRDVAIPFYAVQTVTVIVLTDQQERAVRLLFTLHGQDFEDEDVVNLLVEKSNHARE